MSRSLRIAYLIVVDVAGEFDDKDLRVLDETALIGAAMRGVTTDVESDAYLSITGIQARHLNLDDAEIERLLG